MQEFTCDECEAPFTSHYSRSRFCSDACRYRSKCRNRAPRRPVGYGVCPCGTAFGGKYGETWCKPHRGVLVRPEHGPRLTDWPMYGPTTAPPSMSCESCGVTFHGRRRRFCSEQCSRHPIDDDAPAFTTIDVGTCLKCGSAYAHRADTIAAGYCSALHNKQAKRSARKRLARAGTSEPYTLREIADRDGWRCHLCGGKVPDRNYAARDKDPTIDHLIPVSAGGDDTRVNVALAHNRCNWERGNQGLAQLRLAG